MRINQCEYAEARMGKFTYFLEKYKLKDYFSEKEPAIFFGMYSKNCLKTLKRHKSLAIVIWRGTDIISKDRLKSVKDIKDVDIRHIAISYSITKDLKKNGVKYTFLPLNATKIDDIKVKVLGNELYAYVLSSRHNFYGGPIIDKINKNCKFKINIASSSNSYTKEELFNVYKKSFLGLRLTEHDGIANQVIEMGLMGRRCIHNGNHPNAIKWKSIDDIMETIEIESKKIGTIDNELAEEVMKYINVGDKWLNTEYWR